MSRLSLSGVSKTFPNGTEALRGFDLLVEEGEFLTLIGPSGCGKSTVLRLIAGLEKPSAGAIERAGGEAGIGFVFQDPTLMPWACAFTNVWLPLRLRGVSRAAARERVEEALAFVGLADFAEARPRELSGGMRMRVAIARALVTRPSLLLMDEPFAALDEITRFHLNDELLALKQRLGFTTVFVTHSIFEAAYLSSRVAIMTPRPGRVAEEVANPRPLPRGDAFRGSPEFAALAARLSLALRSGAESRLDKAALAGHS